MSELSVLRTRARELALAMDYGPEAEDVNAKILALDPADISSMNRKAKCLRLRGATADAIALYESVLTIDATNNVARNALGKLRPTAQARRVMVTREPAKRRTKKVPRVAPSRSSGFVLDGARSSTALKRNPVDKVTTLPASGTVRRIQSVLPSPPKTNRRCTAMPTDQDIRQEQAFLDHAVQCLAEMKSMPPDWSGAAANKQASEALLRHGEAQAAALRQLRDIAVGRIDLAEGDTYRIGPQVIWDGSTAIVLSWAAPAAQPYFEASPDDPMGLVLRRRYRAKGSRLVGLEDARFQSALDIPAQGAAASTLEPGASSPPDDRDDLLLEELGRQRTGAMEQIVATIQGEQYRMIVRPGDIPFVVQGGPGTGKTVVGLHRAALLAYRSSEEGPQARILIVGPNPVFIQYIRFVLPSLGEHNVTHLAVSDLAGVSVTKVDDPRVADVKGRAAMADVIAAAVRELPRVPTEDLAFEIRGTRFSVDAAAVAGLFAGFDPAGRSYNSARRRFRDRLERIVDLAYARAPNTSRSQLLVRDGSVVRGDGNFARYVDRAWPSATAEELVRRLLGSPERLKRAAGDHLSETDRRLIERRSEDDEDRNAWTPSDAALIDEARTLIEGRPQDFWHVVLDEAQDLTPMELRMVYRRVRGGAVTVLGDLGQATGAWAAERWEDLLVHLGISGASVDELRHGYRVPRQIMDVARPILDYTAPTVAPPESYREGPAEPLWIEVAAADRAAQAVAQAMRPDRSGGTTAIIVPARLREDMRKELARAGATFDDDGANLGTSIELIEPRYAKGLEFDHVVVVEPTLIVRDNVTGRGLQELYVALTRATQTLACVYSERLPVQLAPGRR